MFANSETLTTKGVIPAVRMADDSSETSSVISNAPAVALRDEARYGSGCGSSAARERAGARNGSSASIVTTQGEMVDAKFFATAVLTQRETGGNLSEVLDNLAGVIRERFKVKRQVRVISAHGRITGLVLGLLPVAVAGALMVVSPTHLRLLIDDPLGLDMLGAGVTLQIIGVLAIRRIVNVEY